VHPEYFWPECCLSHPFNTTTQIRFSIPEHGSVRLAEFDVRGAGIATPVNGRVLSREYGDPVRLDHPFL
jgi:hypothetical protein